MKNNITLRMVLNLKAAKILNGLTVFLLLAFTLFLPISLHAQQNVGIGTTTPAPTAKLEVTSTGQGVLLPRLTTQQRDAIVSPANSLIIYNMSTNCFQWWDTMNSVWENMSCGPCPVPTAPIAGTNTPTTTQITWAWNTSAGALSYSYNSINNFSTATNNGTNTTSIQTGLTCGTAYTLYVWASNSCGNSLVATLTQTTSTCPVPAPTCGSQVWMAANINTGTQITAATNPQAVGQKWCYQDLPANCNTYGGMYQWATAANLPSADNSTLVYGAGLPNCDPCNGSGVQGICPSGYHIPTDLEMSRYEWCIETTIVPAGTTTLATFQTGTGVKGSTVAGVGPGDKMKSNTPAWTGGTFLGNNASGFTALPAGSVIAGSSSSLGSFAHFWLASESSNVNGASRGVFSSGSQTNHNPFVKTDGFSVRCLQN